MLHSKCVPVSLYAQKCADFDALLDKYHALKLAGAIAPPEPKPGRVVQAGPTADEAAHARMVTEIVESGAKELAKARDISLEAARAEIAGLRGLAIGGSMMDPPV